MSTLHKWILSAGAALMVLWLSLVVFIVGGWGLNLVAVFKHGFATYDFEFVVRVIGIVLVPIGVFMGWFA